MPKLTVPSYIMSLDDPGDMQAPKGSPDWARAVRYELQRLARQSKASVRYFQTYLKLLEEHQGYQQLEDPEGHPFPTLGAFAVAKMPFGLGYNPEVILHIQEETRDMLLKEKLDEIRVLQHGGDRRSTAFQVDNCQLEKTKGGNSARYLRSVLKREYPEIFAALERKEYRSVRAAAKAAGLVHDLTPLDYLHRYWRAVPQEERLRFLIEMLTPNERRALALGFEEEES